MRTVQTVGLAALGLLTACASGTSKPGEQVDANDQVDSNDPEMLYDARPDSTPVIPPDAPPDACVPTVNEKLANPVLDLTPNGTGWVDGRDPAVNMLAGGPFPIISANPSGIPAQSAPNKAWLGGAYGQQVSPPKLTLVDNLHQDVAIPATATNIVVSGHIRIETAEIDAMIWDRFSIDLVQTNGTVIENVMTATNLNASGAYALFTKNITANVGGQTVRLRLTSINDDIRQTNFYVDSLSLKATHCP